MQAELREQLQGSQVPAGVLQTYGDSRYLIKDTSQGAGAGQPSGGRCCAHIHGHCTQMQARLWEKGQVSQVLAGVVTTCGDSS